MNTSSLAKSTAAIVVAAAGISGAIFWAQDSLAHGPFGPGHQGMSGGGQHMALLVDHINAEAGTTPQQKAQIDALLAPARSDLEAFQAQAHEDHKVAIAVLTQERIDRGELENLRQGHMRVADQASRRVTQLLGDIAEVLTPDQRRALALHVQKHRGH